MAAITLFPLVGRGDEGSGGGGGGCVCEGETQPSEALLARVMAQWRDGGGSHVYNEDALSAALYCTLSLIGAQIRASHYNHLHTDHCTVQRGDVAAMTADPLMWPPQGNGGTAVRQLCRLERRIGKAHIGLHVLPCYTCVPTRGDTLQPEVAAAASLRAHICLLAMLLVSLDKLCSTDEALCSSHIPSPRLPQHSFALMCCRATQGHGGQYPVELICTRSHWHRKKLCQRGKGGCC